MWIKTQHGKLKNHVPGLDSLIKNFPQPCISFSNGYGIIKSENSLFGAIGISVGMPAVFITYAIPRAFQLIYSPKGEGRRPEEKNEDREGKDADGGVAAALSRRGKVWAGRTDSTTECGWEG